MASENDEIISVYVDDKTKVRLKTVADKHYRSLAAQIRFIIDKWIENDNDE